MTSPDFCELEYKVHLRLHLEHKPVRQCLQQRVDKLELQSHVSSLGGCHKWFVEGVFELWRLEVLIRLAKNICRYHIPREGSEGAIERNHTTIQCILVDLAAKNVELLLYDRLKIRDALLGKEWQQRRLADFVKIMIGRSEDGARYILSVDEVVILVHPPRTIESRPVVRIGDMKLVRVDPYDRSYSRR